MFEEMAIGVKIALTGNPTQELDKFTRAVKKAYEGADLLSKSLKLVNEQFLKSTEILAKLNPSLKEFNDVLGLSSKSTKGLNASFSGLNRRLDGMSERMTAITRKASMLAEGLEGVTAATGMASMAASAGFGAAGFAAGKSGGHSGGGHFGGIGFTGGAIALGAGLMMAHAGYDASKEYQQVLSQIMLQNIPGSSANQFNQFINSQNIAGVSKLDLLQKLQDALVITKDVPAAEGLAPFLAQIGYANKALYGGTAQELSENQFRAMVKSAELLTGSMDSKVLIPVIDEQVKLLSATSGQVTPEQIQQVLTKSRGFLKNSDPKILYQLEPLIQEVGSGSKVGTGIYTFFAHMLAGRVTTAAAKQLEKYGIVDPNAVEYTTTGRIKRIQPGGIKHTDMMKKNFIDWYDNFFLKQLAAHGVTNIDDIEKVNSTIYTNTDLFLVNLLAQQQAKIAKTAALNAHAAGTAQMLKQVPAQTASEQALAASFYAFKKSLGDLTSGPVIDGMNHLTIFLNQITKALNYIGSFNTGNHPLLSKISNLFDSSSDSVFNKQPSQPEKHQASSTSQPIVINVDGRTLMQTVLPHLNQNMYHAQVQQSNSFMPGMTPISPNTGIPYR